jgi:hemerythrin-like domain-containing protein
MARPSESAASQHPITITQALRAEHVVFHNLFDHIERATPEARTLAEIRTLARVMESMLLAHAAVEDGLLMEPLQPTLSHMGQQENFHQEHEEIDGDLRAVFASRKLTEAKWLLQKVVVMSRRHFYKEETVIFPLAERVLSSKSLTTLGRRWAEQRKLPPA